MHSTSGNTRILVCCHKRCELPEDAMLLPVHVGASLSHESLGIQRDDMCRGMPCDNISKSNPSYCELTAVYWAWKNLRDIEPDIEYVGVNHYRRFFEFGPMPPYVSKVVRPQEDVQWYRVDANVLSRRLSRCDAVLPRPVHFPYSLFMDYARWHHGDDLRAAMRVVHRLRPDYDGAMYDVLIRGNRLSPCNMGIMRWDVFDGYCSWLFGVLFALEEFIDTSSYDTQQGRVYGFVAERLLNVWLRAEGVRVSYLPIAQFSGTRVERSPRSPLGIIRKDVSYKAGRDSAWHDMQDFKRNTCT